MSAPSQPSTSGRPHGGKPRAGNRNARNRPNRSQQRAMEIRAAATISPDFVEVGGASPEVIGASAAPSLPATGARAARRAAVGRAKAVVRPAVLSRAEEYRHIRADLRRLLITAGSLLAVMVILLIILEG